MSAAPAPRFSLRMSGLRNTRSDTTESTEKSSHWIQACAASSVAANSATTTAATPKKMM